MKKLLTANAAKITAAIGVVALAAIAITSTAQAEQLDTGKFCIQASNDNGQASKAGNCQPEPGTTTCTPSPTNSCGPSLQEPTVQIAQCFGSSFLGKANLNLRFRTDSPIDALQITFESDEQPLMLKGSEFPAGSVSIDDETNETIVNLAIYPWQDHGELSAANFSDGLIFSIEIEGRPTNQLSLPYLDTDASDGRSCQEI